MKRYWEFSLIILIISLLLDSSHPFFSAAAQSGSWTVRLESEKPAVPQFLLPASDGGTLLVGLVSYADQSDIWLAKLSALGALEWETGFDRASANLTATAVIPVLSGGYYLAVQNGRQSHILKLTADGAVVWALAFRACQITELLELSDGSLLMGGRREHPTLDDAYQSWVAKTSSGGLIVWERSLSNAYQFQHVAGMVEGREGELILTGAVMPAFGSFDGWLAVLNAQGQLLQQVKIDRESLTSSELPVALFFTGDGSLLVLGYLISNGDRSIWVAEFSTGYLSLLWQKEYRSSVIGEDNFIDSIVPFSDGSLLLAGRYGRQNSPYWLMMLARNGEVLWSRVDSSNRLKNPVIAPASGGGAIIGGNDVAPGPIQSGPTFLAYISSEGISGDCLVFENTSDLMVYSAKVRVSAWDMPLIAEEVTQRLETAPALQVLAFSSQASNFCAPSGPPYSITGQITDRQGAPAVGVTVTTQNGQSARSDSRGFFTLTVDMAGEYILTTEQEGYTFDPVRKTVNVGGGVAVVNFTRYPCRSADTGLDVCDLQLGDVLLEMYNPVNSKGAFFILLGGSFFTHAALYAGVVEEPENPGTWRRLVIEAAGLNKADPAKEVRSLPIYELEIWSGNVNLWDWAIVRPNATSAQKISAAAFALDVAERTEVRYALCAGLFPDCNDPTGQKEIQDVLVAPSLEDDTSFYCSKLVWRAYQQAGNDIAWRKPELNQVFSNWITPEELFWGAPRVQWRAHNALTMPISMRMYSPAHLLLTDPLGRRTGYDPTSGLTLNEIPQVIYSGTQSLIETINVTGESDFSGWVLTANGFDTGTYHLEISHLADSSAYSLIQSTITPEQIDRYHLQKAHNSIYLPQIRR